MNDEKASLKCAQNNMSVTLAAPFRSCLIEGQQRSQTAVGWFPPILRGNVSDCLVAED